MGYTFALVGNPNSGKTTIFNEITGSSQYVGNWPGVTVEKKEGRAVRFDKEIKVVDLPGIYSLSPYSMEEVIARDYILGEKPDVLINIIDATNIERNLYLTTQLLELGIPVVAALNMMDALKQKGDSINTAELEKLAGIPVIPTSANKGRGVRQLLEKAVAAAGKEEADRKAEAREAAGKETAIGISPLCLFDHSIEKTLSAVEKLYASSIKCCGSEARWTSVKLLEGDEKVFGELGLSDIQHAELKSLRQVLEKEYDSDIESIIADNRYRSICSLLEQVVTRKSESSGLTLSDRIDKVATNRILAIPLFMAVMFGVFRITFGAAGSGAIDWLDNLINNTLSGRVSEGLRTAGAAEWLHTLIVDGIITGMGSILVFIPQIMLLFLFLSVLEDSGYMARAAFVMDRLLRKLGLSGKSFIPMLMGFGCSVPAIMAARTLENEKDRKLTIILTPFMSCGARLPVYALFTAAFFSRNQSLVVFSVYMLGIVVAVISGILLKKTVLKGENAPFVMELPPYRLPNLKSLGLRLWDRGKGFLVKAGTVIFAASVIIWFLQTFSFSLSMVNNAEDSIFAGIGNIIAPVFKPLGFGDWKSSVALLTGFVAKEAVVATMGILHGIGNAGENSTELAAALQQVFTPLKAYAFMAFTLLYLPCIAAFATIRREMNSWKWTFFAVGYQTGAAWLVAFLIYQGGRLFGLE